MGWVEAVANLKLSLVFALCACLIAGGAPTSAAPSGGTFGPAIDAPHYEGQERCSPKAKPGVLAFQSMVLVTYPGTGAGSISRDCSVGGTSEHKEGRAWDWGVAASDKSDVASVDDLLEWLLKDDRYGNDAALARRLGIMYLIWNKRMWSTWDGWETYCEMKKGECRDPESKSVLHPHTDHVHFSFTWAGAKKETTFWNPNRSYLASFASASDGSGHWAAGANGSILVAGDAGFYGSKNDVFLKQPIVDIAATPSGYGYWLTNSKGKVFPFGDASKKRPDTKMQVAGIASTDTGKGYWLASTQGRVAAVGDAEKFDKLAEEGVKVTDIASTLTGEGYWLFADDGRVFPYGDAGFFGGAAEADLEHPIVSGANYLNEGYWMVTDHGRVFAFGDARMHGDLTDKELTLPVIGMAPTPTGEGYWLLTAGGRVFDFGDARVFPMASPKIQDSDIYTSELKEEGGQVPSLLLD